VTVTLPPRDRAVADQRLRDRRIRQLADEGWKPKQIALEVGITRQRVQQILASEPSREELIETTIRGVEIELAYLAQITTTLERHAARARALRHQLTRLEEEREASRIDRLLGLA
jgi:predicted transcriptional regulator